MKLQPLKPLNRKPNKWKPLAILFTILVAGSTAETSRIFTSSDQDIVSSGPGLKIMALIISGIFLFLAIWFWRKSAGTKQN